MMTLWERDPLWCDMWCGPTFRSLQQAPCPCPLWLVIHQLIWRKRWPGSPVMWFAIACFLLFTKVLWIEAFSVHKCSYLWHENNKSILFSTWYCVSAVIKFHAVLTNNVKCESNNWKMKRNYLQALLRDFIQLVYDVFISRPPLDTSDTLYLRGLRYYTRDWFKLISNTWLLIKLK